MIAEIKKNELKKILIRADKHLSAISIDLFELQMQLFNAKNIDKIEEIEEKAKTLLLFNLSNFNF